MWFHCGWGYWHVPKYFPCAAKRFHGGRQIGLDHIGSSCKLGESLDLGVSSTGFQGTKSLIFIDLRYGSFLCQSVHIGLALVTTEWFLI